jgi:hypothetical protein
MCIAEGHHIEHQSLLQLYETTDTLPLVDMPDDPIHPLSEGLSLPDLRKCINRLQLHFCGPNQLYGPILQSPVVLEDLADWSLDRVITETQFQESRSGMLPIHRLQVHSDIISFADCYLIRGPLETPEVCRTYSIDTCTSCAILGAYVEGLRSDARRRTRTYQFV